MIIVGRVHHRLGGRAAGSGQLGEHVVGHEFPHLANHMRPEPDRQLPRLEFPGPRRFHHVLEFQARGREQPPRDVQLNPRRCLEFRVLVVGQVYLLIAPRAAHHLPGIAGQVRAMDDERADGTLAGGFLEFVGPPTVVGHGVALEEFRIFRRRLVDDDENDLSLHVDALEVVPFIFGCVDPITHVDDGRIEVDAVGLRLIAGHVIIAQLQVGRRALGRLQGHRRPRLREHAGKSDLLQVGAVVARRLQAIQCKLRRDVIRRDVAAPRPGPASLEQIVRQEPDVRANSLGVDALERGRHAGREAQFHGRVARGPRARSNAHAQPQRKHCTVHSHDSLRRPHSVPAYLNGPRPAQSALLRARRRRPVRRPRALRMSPLFLPERRGFRRPGAGRGAHCFHLSSPMPRGCGEHRGIPHRVPSIVARRTGQCAARARRTAGESDLAQPHRDDRQRLRGSHLRMEESDGRSHDRVQMTRTSARGATQRPPSHGRHRRDP